MVVYCEGSSVVGRTERGDSSSFKMKPGVHQKSSVLSDLSPRLSATVMAMVRGGESSILGATGDLIFMPTTREDQRRKLAEWRLSLVTKGLKVDSGKIQLMVSVGDRELQEEWSQESGAWPCGVCSKGVELC